MSAHLLQLAIGPVQDLIERARRTRDLWFGSMLLSEISKAAARSLRDNGGTLIFPDHDADLVPDSDLSIANIIVAELPEGRDPQTLACQAKQAALRLWRERFADPVHDEFRSLIRDPIWNDQVNDIFELFAAWVAFSPDTYQQQRRRLGQLMAGRKNCRDFLPANGRPGVPKSSLDGLRETVLKDEKVEAWPAKMRRRLRVRPGEQLDVLGLIKRTASDDEDKPVSHRHYPSVSRVAADPWLRGIARADQGHQRLAALRAVCTQLRNEGLLNRIDQKRYPQYHDFPFEGSALYRSRHHELEEETLEQDEPHEAFERLRVALADLEDCARSAGLGSEPDPYVAILVADGDRMGAAISSLQSPQAHRTFSRELAQFARDAAGVVRERCGVLVYSGGDDVLAFAPLNECLPCARQLHSLFHTTMVRALPEVPKEELPTLSVGVALGHFLENLEDLLGFGRAAEKAAKKPDRNGLAVHLHKRGGAPIKVRKQWTENLDERLASYAKWFLAGAVSNRTPYDLEQLASVYEDWQGASLVTAITRDAIRVIDKKRPGGVDDQRQAIRAAVEQRIHNAAELRALAAELLIARQLAVGLRQSGGATS